MKSKYIIENESGIIILAEELTEELNGGEIILLSGSLGAGKTTFVKALTKSLGNKEVVTSPTFVLRNEYMINNGNLIHIDLYRIESTKFNSIEFLEDIGDKNTITCIEWPARILDIDKLVGKKYSISFKILPNDVREVAIKIT